MGRMSELHAAAPDALGLAIETLGQAAWDADWQAKKAVWYPTTAEFFERKAERCRDAIETLKQLAEVLELPGAPDAMGGETRT